jgi:hypothetical protein
VKGRAPNPWAVAVVGGLAATVIGGLVLALILSSLGTSDARRPSSAQPPVAQSRASGPTGTPEPSTTPPNEASVGSPQRTTEFLTDVAEVSGEASYPSGGSAAINGTDYSKSIYQCDCNFRYVDYDLGRGYWRFRASIGVEDSAPTDVGYEFHVFADGELVYSRAVYYGEPAVDLDIDVTAVLRLRLTMNQLGHKGSQGSWAIWGSARLLGLHQSP